MQDQEKCRSELATNNNTCPSLYKCIDGIRAVNKSEWVWAKQTWIKI